MEQSHLISTAWSEHAKNVPQWTFWPIITDLWNERVEVLSGACLTSLQWKTQVTHFSRDSEGLEWTSAACLWLTLTVQKQCQHADNVLCYWTISLGIPALRQLYLPAVICRSSLLKISSLPLSLFLTFSVVCFHTQEVTVFRDHDCKGVWPKNYIKNRVWPTTISTEFCLLLEEAPEQLFQFTSTGFFGIFFCC